MDRAALSDVESDEQHVAPHPQRWGKIALAVGAACAVLVVGFAGGSYFRSSQALSQEVAPLGLSQIAVIPPNEECAGVKGENCIAQKCCKKSGFKCYEVHAGFAKCMKECIPGKNGNCYHHDPAMVPGKRSAVTLSANTLFCWTFHVSDSGSTMPNTELDLLRTQLFLGASIFGCEEYRVYSDVEAWLSPNKINTIKVDDTEGNFHFAKRKKMGTWVNSNLFIAAWKKIRDEGAWTKWDWTVKIDPTTVFIPIRLRNYLDKMEVTDNGIYLETCKYVPYGFYGPIAVTSRDAAAKYMANLDDCKATFNYMGPTGPNKQAWGEDLFQQRCMDLHGVDKVAAYDLSVDSRCGASRPEGQKKNAKWKPDCAVVKTPAIHKFTKPKDYFDCLKMTQRGQL